MNTGFLGPAVATVLTVYGIETCITYSTTTPLSGVATVLTVYGIETTLASGSVFAQGSNTVATVLTVYGIETDPRKKMNHSIWICCNSTYRLRY